LPIIMIGICLSLDSSMIESQSFTFRKDFSYVQSYIRTTPSARRKYDLAIERKRS
jgi:hypothetical protein